MLVVAALYQFTSFEDPAELKPGLMDICVRNGVKGSLLVAQEGINGTIAGSRDGIDQVIAYIKTLPGCDLLDWKESASQEMPFRKMKVRLKREIVTMGQPDVDPIAAVGNYVSPEDWNELIQAPDVAVIDTRNDYEIEIGTFEGAINPETKSFGEFPAWWEENKAKFEGKRIAMFCTGGIRCEKSTNFLLGQGVEDVFHLKGGILKYLENVPEDKSLWDGECYVFDQRVSVKHGLEQGSYTPCHACGRPVSDDDKQHPDYIYAIQCPSCKDEYTEEDRARFKEREKQIALSIARGELP